MSIVEKYKLTVSGFPHIDFNNVSPGFNGCSDRWQSILDQTMSRLKDLSRRAASMRISRFPVGKLMNSTLRDKGGATYGRSGQPRSIR